MIRLIFLISISLPVFAAPVPGEQDHYRNFQELAASNLEGRDFAIVQKESPSEILVMAFHGGLIEPGTSELAEAIAGQDFDYYGFKGFRDSELDQESFTAADLHLTSARFNEPELMKKTESATFCIGIHGFGGEEADFCVGGSNVTERQRLVRELSEKFPGLKSCELCCPPFNGVARNNPPNKCRDGGIQVEMSPKIRRRILSDEKVKAETAEAFRSFLSTSGR
jgi:phage replication-related protein YjqB (UPF0714/DUF867 family)